MEDTYRKNICGYNDIEIKSDGNSEGSTSGFTGLTLQGDVSTNRVRGFITCSTG